MEDMEENEIEEVMEVKFMLAAKIITEENFNRARVRSVLYKTWTNVKLHIADLSPHLYLISFIAEEDMQKILTESPWSMMGQLVNLKRWEKVIPINNIDFSKTPFWIQIHGLSEDQLTLKNAQEIGESLGEVLEAENPMEGGLLRRYFLRVRVMIDLQMPLVAGLWSPILGNTNSWLDLRYEKLSRFCYRCGLISHAAKNCTNVEARSTVLPRYGPRLRAPPETTLGMSKQHREKLVSQKVETQTMWQSLCQRRKNILQLVKKGRRRNLLQGPKKEGDKSIIGGGIFYRKKRTTEIEKDPNSTSLLEMNIQLSPPSTFSMSPGRIESVHLNVTHVARATRNFSPALQIGEGYFGKVYVGKLDSGQEVAVKRFKKEHFENLRTEFSSEAELLAKVEHRNIVKLFGYVDKGNEMLIITEFVRNGTLREHLDGQRGKILDFNQRVEIAIDVAHGLTFLHFYAENQIIHRDVKSSNILLTESMRAKVANFGYARLGPMDSEQSHVSTKVKGTVGYLDPEYMRTYQLTAKSDVYSFGILLLEILTGRRPVELMRPIHERVTVRWAFHKYTEGDDVVELVDPAMEEIVDAELLVKMFVLAFQCAAPLRNDRPDMITVTRQLWTIRAGYLKSSR